MKLSRAVINQSVSIALDVADHFKFHLPDFAYWTIEDWDKAGEEYHEVRNCMLGWDVTDFGSNDFRKVGRVLFTLRNGRFGTKQYPKEYAEKLLIDPQNQRAPAHFHKKKREDIICRAGGNILVQLTKADIDGNPSAETFTVQVDGCTKRLSPGDIVRLKPGMSLNIVPHTIHQFWGEEGTGYAMHDDKYTLSSEISSVCDDRNDNFFLVDYGVRFPEIDEDEARKYYLCHEYPEAVATQPTNS
ncbi:D-lyxose/D-mannose family sugar isomerase [Dyadobacter sp. CY323]|uniref:D-lyxose/D-mannose family sugar isomerase n=1 Tax=Dyadobacter sp. CY323 TaxID=2907302 RepID=UPI001F44A89A|nr:D-lyxose/D-mannose family sugar isomerase [Dyadobacter sp. CY323]MCE6989708.1 D-lyxose/D-mannose family sugar isomerase [Dyadobacter sp. CY323]